MRGITTGFSQLWLSLLYCFTLMTFYFLFVRMEEKIVILNDIYYNTSSPRGEIVGGKNRVEVAGIRQTVSLCTFAKDEEIYIDEWTDYYLSMGFSEIIIYDNSKTNELAFWKSFRRNNDPQIHVVHWPFDGLHREALLDCAIQSREKNHTWCAILDGDEFLVLKKHKDITSLLEQHLHSGALSINWYFYGDNNHSVYTVLPVTKRFSMRQTHINHHVKSIVKLSDMDMNHEKLINSHYPYLVNCSQHDTNNKTFLGPYNQGGPSDIAVVNHYKTKSKKEFHYKGCIRGISDVVNKSSKENFGKCGEQHLTQGCNIFDDTAWTYLRDRVTKYQMFDHF